MESFWDRHAHRFDKDADPGDRAIAAARRHLTPDARVLEIGCAAGSTARALRPSVTSWHGIDVSAEMIQRAKARGGDISYQQATIERAEETYSAVIAFNVLHFMDLPSDIDRIRDRLEPGGLLLAQTPCLADMQPMMRAVFPVVARLMRLPELNRLRFQELRAMVADRFEIIEEDHARATGTWLVARKAKGRAATHS